MSEMIQSFEFSDNELQDMRQFYEAELHSALRKLEHIKNVLNKIGSSPTNFSADLSNLGAITVTTGYSGKPQYVPESEEEVMSKKGAGKKRGPKPVWGNFILRRLRQTDRPLSYAEILDDAIRMNNIPPAKRKNAKASILNSAFRLRTIHNKIDTIGEKGKKQKYMVLAKWLDKKGNLVAPYDKKYKAILKNDQ